MARQLLCCYDTVAAICCGKVFYLTIMVIESSKVCRLHTGSRAAMSNWHIDFYLPSDGDINLYNMIIYNVTVMLL